MDGIHAPGSKVLFKFGVTLFLLVLLPHVHGANKAFQYNYKDRAVDDVIQSEDFPSAYPPHLNVTWQYSVNSGQWAVVKKVFELDSGNDDPSSYDWLELDDNQGRKVKYTAANPPVVHFKTAGPELIVRFVSDGKSEEDTKGFQLAILYGASERELDMKIHDETKTKDPPKEEESSPMLIIISACLIILVVIIIAGVAFLLHRHRNRDSTNNRNAFGVRKNSGISHNRRAGRAGADGVAVATSPSPQEQNEQQQPHHHHSDRQHQRQIERPVQRSNSQLNWMARAELTTTIQNAGRAPKPNIYTPTSVTNDTRDTLVKNVKTASSSHRERQRSLTNGDSRHDHQTSAAAFRRSFSDNDSVTPNTYDHGGFHSVPRDLGSGVSVVKLSSVSTSSHHVDVPSVSFHRDHGKGNRTKVHIASCEKDRSISPRNTMHKDRNYEGSVTHYSDTVDSLKVASSGAAMGGIGLDILPPSYADSYLSPPPPYAKQGLGNSQSCYENVPYSSSPTRQWINSQTNIYINAGGAFSGSSSSLSRITIDSSNLVSPTPCLSQETISSTTIDSPSSNQNEENKTDVRISANREGGQRETPAPSSVQVIDGYAYLIPQSLQIEDRTSHPETRHKTEETDNCLVPQEQPTNPDSALLHTGQRPIPCDGGYVEVSKVNRTDTSKNVYVNLPEN